MLARSCTSVVVDLFLYDCAVDVVGTETLCYLGDGGGHHDPIRFDVRNVVQHQARYSDLFQISESRGGLEMCQSGVGGMKRERYERNESIGLVLHLSQSHQVIGQIFGGLEMAVEHCAIALEPDLMCGSSGLQPFVAIDLVIANNAAYALGENFGAAARKRVDACIF